MYQNQHSAVCPVCGQTDAVRKVSSVVSEGTSSTDQFGVAPNLLGRDLYVLGSQGTMVTELAQRLTPTTKRPGGIGLRIGLAAIALSVASTMACGLSAFVVRPE